MKGINICPSHVMMKDHSPGYFLILFMAYFLLGGQLISCSHQARNREPILETKNTDQIMREMKNLLKLTPEQEVNTRPIIENQVEKRKALIQKYQGKGRQGMDSLRDELKDLRVSTENQLQYFLTNEQMIKYGYMQQEEDQGIISGRPQEEGGQKRPKGGGPKPGRDWRQTKYFP